MPDHRLSDVLVHPHYDLAIADLVSKWKLLTFVDILVVVDTEISTDPANDFGIASVIDLIRNTKIGCMRFRVDIALRNGAAQSVTASPTPTQPKYVGFRFDMAAGGSAVIDKYEQIWCFGFKPSNSGNTSDAEIDQASAFPASNAELNKLDEWMTVKKGGLFGTGDHHFLGASMCRKIPRLGTMRRWTNADGVPPIGTPARIDTLRPPSAAFEPGAPGQQSMNNSPHQGDLVVQPIRWVADASHWFALFFRHKRPHPVLCHPTLGPIDVMPDHAHEGLCVPNPDLAANKKFKAEREYPDATDGGSQPRPKIIAYGSNLAQPPYLFGKGAQSARNDNPMIAVYNGHRAGVGRVATDSTWHHWMDVNIDNIRLADTLDWKKIKRYFQNLAVWLNPPGYSTRCFYHSVFASHFETVGFQEYYRGATVTELGTALRGHLHFHWGPCWVTERIYDIIRDYKLFKRVPFPELREKLPDGAFDGQRLETEILGRMVQATMEVAEQVKAADGDPRAARLRPLPVPEKLFAAPVAEAVKAFVAETESRCKGDTSGLRALFA
ncbi:MAG: hypothetical protein LC648_09635 [Novosphingobium sp.]|nr:hypothetical protein [Novosphingobium sp.]